MASSTEAQIANLLNIASDPGSDAKKVIESLIAFEQLVEGRADLFEPQTAAALNFVEAANEQIREWAVSFLEYLLSRSPFNYEQKESLLQRALPILENLIKNDQSSVVVKKTISCNASLYPFLFKTILAEGQQTWRTACEIKNAIISLLANPRTDDGVKVYVIKYLQVVVIVQSRHVQDSMVRQYEDISLSICPPTHPFLDPQLLEQEAIAILHTLLILLRKESSGIITAVINSLGPLLRARPQYIENVINVFGSWMRTPPSHLNESQMGNVEKSIRILLMSLLKAQPSSPSAMQIFDALVAMGGKQELAQFPKQFRQLLQQQNDGRTSMKRGATSGIPEFSKRQRLEGNDISNTIYINNILFFWFDVTQFPLPLVVEIILGTLQNISPGRLNQTVLQAQSQNTPSTPPPRSLTPPIVNLKTTALRRESRLRDPRLRAAGAAASSSPPQSVTVSASTSVVETTSNEASQMSSTTTNVQTVVPLECLKHEETRSPLPITTEKVDEKISIKIESEPESQLIIQIDSTTKLSESILIGQQELPFSLPPPGPLSFEECRSLMKSRVKSIFNAETRLPTGGMTTKIDSGPKTSEQSESYVSPGMTKSQWMMIISRLLTRGLNTDWEIINEPESPTKSDDTKSVAKTETDAHMEEVQSKTEPEDILSDVKKIEEKKEESKEQVESGKEIDARDIKEKNDELRELMMKYILEDFRGRMELALTWLYEEWYHDNIMLRNSSSYSANYAKWLRRLLDAAMPALEAKDQTFSSFLLDVPELPEDVVDRVKIYCNDPDRMQLGFSTLSQLIEMRPPVRQCAMNILLQYSIHKDRITRSSAIVTLRKWWGAHDNSQIAAEIQSFAIKSLNELCLESPPLPYDYHYHLGSPVAEQGSSSAERLDQVTSATTISGNDELTRKWTEQEITKRLELYLALVAKQHELLSELFNAYKNASIFVRKIMTQNMIPVIKSIGMNSPKLLQLIRNFPEGCDTLALKMVVSLTSAMRPSPQLVSTVKSAMEQRNLDSRFLIPIISALEKNEIIVHLPKVINILDGTETQKRPVKEVFTTGSTTTPPAQPTTAPLIPSELLLALHHMDGQVSQAKLAEAIKVCLSMTNIFKSEVLAVVLQQLVDEPELPNLIMFTLYQSVNSYKRLIGFVTNLLSRLITKKVWDNPDLWKGFIKCCKITLPNSLPVLSQLPMEKLQMVLQMDPSFKEPLKKHVQNSWNENQRRNRMPYLTSLLEING
ncbi:9364_t:CDS:10 [Ambispora leptoticha]|uniref:9364_t:CDS:1 n=1 Tax=Ambispora leptoticha TaxID=144679 RepID=A0A9N8ZI98_9GLOM|nr:9364_t:CDS:10 [Ambispora leptoticha]